VELDRAHKWVQTAITIESGVSADFRFDHATPLKCGYEFDASYWDTLDGSISGWGKEDQSLSYIDAAWRMLNSDKEPPCQIYEKSGGKKMQSAPFGWLSHLLNYRSGGIESGRLSGGDEWTYTDIQRRERMLPPSLSESFRP